MERFPRLPLPAAAAHKAAKTAILAAFAALGAADTRAATETYAANGSRTATIPFPQRINPPVLLAMPSANVLGHYQYMLSGRFQYFTTSAIGDTTGGAEASTTETKSLTYASELLFGIENRAEVGMQYGQELAFSIKALLVREDVFWPDLVFGVRNILGSPEGGLYGIEDEDVLETLYGESYATIAKRFPSDSRVHLGFSYLNGANKNAVGLNAGLEQDLGAGAYLGYEVFERFSDFHQVLTLCWRYKDLLGVSIGLTEFQSWIRQDGEWGFFLAPSKSRPDGYNSPGITFALQVQGFAPRRQKRTLPERVAILEVRNAELEKRLQDMQEALERAEASQSESPAAPDPVPAPVPAPAPVAESIRGQSAALLRAAAGKLAQEVPDPAGVRQIMYNLVTLGPPASEALRQVAADTAAGALRVPALLTMAFSRDTAHVRTLQALCADKDPVIRREALTALTKIDPRAALDDARRLLSDPDETVAMAAGEAYRMLGGKTPEAAPEGRPGASAPPASKAAPAAPKAKPPGSAKAANAKAAKPASKGSAKTAKAGGKPAAAPAAGH